MELHGIQGDLNFDYLTDHGIYVVKAPTKKVDDALEGIARMAEKHSAIDMDAVHCPECRSIHVEFPSRPEMSATAAITSKIAEATGLKSPSFQCRNCQYSWTPNNDS